MNEPLTLEQAAERLRDIGECAQKVAGDIVATRKYLAELEEQARVVQSDWADALYRLTLAATAGELPDMLQRYPSGLAATQ